MADPNKPTFHHPDHPDCQGAVAGADAKAPGGPVVVIATSDRGSTRRPVEGLTVELSWNLYMNLVAMASAGSAMAKQALVESADRAVAKAHRESQMIAVKASDN